MPTTNHLTFCNNFYLRFHIFWQIINDLTELHFFFGRTFRKMNHDSAFNFINKDACVYRCRHTHIYIHARAMLRCVETHKYF